jgi:hypothetical protein
VHIEWLTPSRAPRSFSKPIQMKAVSVELPLVPDKFYKGKNQPEPEFFNNLMRKGELRREADAAHEVSETWVGSQRVESGIHPDGGQSIRTSKVGFLQPGEGLLLVSQDRIDTSDVETADIPLPGLRLECS